MAKVFIAHVRSDRTPARRLAGTLRQAGHEPWLAEDELRVGESLSEALARGLKDTDTVVVLLSRNAQESGWTNFELSLIRSDGFARDRLLPVRLDRISLPEGFVDSRPIDLFPGDSAWREGVERLLRVLGGESPAEANLPSSESPPDNLPPRTVPFVGREAELSWLRDRLGPGRCALLWGRVGVGKTSLALEYAARHAADYPGGLWWVPGQAGPERAFAWLAWNLPPEHVSGLLRDELEAIVEGTRREALPEGIACAVVQELEESPEPVLLIVEDMCSKEWAEWCSAHHVTVLGTCHGKPSALMEGIASRRVAPLQQKDIRELLKRMGLAPDSLGAGYERLLRQWLGGRAQLVGAVARLLNQKVMTWEGLEHQLCELREQAVGVIDLCIEQFARGSATRRLLEAIAVFMPEVGIERSWFNEAVEDEQWRALEGQGLIQLQGEVAFIHGGTHQRVRALAAPDDWRDAVQRVLECVRERLIIYREQGEWMEAKAAIADRFHLEAILRTAESVAVPMLWAEVVWLFAECLLRMGQHGVARPLLFRALRLLKRQPQVDLELSASVRMGLAEALEAVGDRGSARKLLEQAVAEDETNARGHPAQKADRLSRLAFLQWEWGMRGRHSKRRIRWSAALQSIDRALHIDRNELGWSHVQLPSRLMLRGRILIGLGRVEEANAVLEEALSVGERVLGPEDLGLVTVLETLAAARAARDDDTSALPLWERAVDISRHRLGEEHLETAYLLTELARVCARLGERVRARLHAERALSILEKNSSPSDPQLLRGLLRIAEVLADVGERTAASEILERALSLQESAGVPDFSGLGVLVGQALFLEEEGLRTVTDVLLSRVLDLARRAPPGEQSERLKLKELVSSILRSRQAIPSSETPVPFLAPTAGAAAGPLARALALLSTSDTAEAEKSRALRQAIEEARRGDDASNGARALFLLADLEGRRGAWEKARESAGQGLQLALRAAVPGLVAEGYRLLADAALHGSYYEEARMSYEEAIRRYDALEDRLRAARTRALLVALLLQLGRHDEAAAHVRWMREHLADRVLTEDARHDMQEVLKLVERRTLSSQSQGARHRTP